MEAISGSTEQFYFQVLHFVQNQMNGFVLSGSSNRIAGEIVDKTRATLVYAQSSPSRIRAWWPNNVSSEPGLLLMIIDQKHVLGKEFFLSNVLQR